MWWWWKSCLEQAQNSQGKPVGTSIEWGLVALGENLVGRVVVVAGLLLPVSHG
jgi:hypothetical protein